MAMELQLSTQRAVAELKAAEAAATQLASRLQSMSGTTASQGLNQLAGASAASISTIRNLNASLSTLSARMTGLDTATAAATARLNNFQGGAGGAGRAAGGFGNMLNGARGVLAAFGVSLGAVGFARFVKEGYEMVNVVESFKTMVGATSGGLKVAEAELDHIRKTSLRLKVDIETTTAAYGKFVSAASGANQEVDVSREQFTKLTEVFRTMGLSQERTKLAFLAIEQMVTKGSIAMQELRRQLGESVPAFAILAKAMGMTTDELNKAIAAGKVYSVENLPKLVTGLHDAYVNAESLARALKKPVSIMTDLTNSTKMLSAELMIGFFEAASEGITAFAEALRGTDTLQAFRDIGTAAGAAFGGIAQAAAFVAKHLDVLKYAILGLAAAWIVARVVTWGSAILQLVGFITLATRATYTWTLATMAMSGVPMILSGIATAWRLVSIATVTAMAAMGPVGRMIMLAAAAATLAGMGLAAMVSSASAAETSSRKLGDQSEDTAQDVNKTGREARLTTDAEHALLPAGNAAAQGQDALSGGANRAAGAMRAATGVAEEYIRILGSLSAKINSMPKYKVDSGGPTYGQGPTNTGGPQYGTPEYGTPEYSNNGPEYSNNGSEYGTPEYGTPEYGGYAKGGIIGMMPREFAAAKSFASAPRLATGTADTSVYPSQPGGGIPAVLHPNEAVVPLTGGGSIPVSMGGLDALYMCLMDANQMLATIHQSIVTVGVLVQTSADRMVVQLGNIATAVGALAISGGSGGGSSGSGGYGTGTGTEFGSGSSGGGSSPFGGRFSSSGDQFGGRLGGRSNPFGGAGMGAGQGGGGVNMQAFQDLVYRSVQAYNRAAEERSRQAMQNVPLNIAEASLPMFQEWRNISADMRTMMDYMNKSEAKTAEKMMRSHGAKFAPLGFQGYTGFNVEGYAEGTPNALKDMMKGGGFQAVLHPGEAVVPLPDGRSIPVDMGNSFSSAAASRNRPVTVHVQMTVNTPDAASFNRSRDQTLQDFSKRLEKSVRNIGSVSSEDDPTRRPFSKRS